MPAHKPNLPCGKYHGQHRWGVPLIYLKQNPHLYDCLHCGKSYDQVLKERKEFASSSGKETGEKK